MPEVPVDTGTQYVIALVPYITRGFGLPEPIGDKSWVMASMPLLGNQGLLKPD